MATKNTNNPTPSPKASKPAPAPAKPQSKSAEGDLQILRAVAKLGDKATVAKIASAIGTGYAAARLRCNRLATDAVGLIEYYAPDYESRGEVQGAGRRGRTPHTVGLTKAGKALLAKGAK